MKMERSEAIAMESSGWWKKMDDYSIAEFQLQEARLCMPFAEFHASVERAIGRSVFTHEFVDFDHLLRELRGEARPRDFSEIFDLIPKEKRIVLRVK